MPRCPLPGRLPVGGIRKALGHEATLRPHRHDHRVLHLLGFYQAQYFGAIVLETVRPAQATPRHLSAPQVNAFHPGGIDKDLEHWQRQRHVRNLRGIQFHTDVGLRPVAPVPLEEVGAQCGADQVQVEPQHPVFTEVLHLFQAGVEFQLQLLLGGVALGLALLAGRVEAGVEHLQHDIRQPDMVHQGVGDEGLTVAETNLAHIPGVGAQNGNIPPAR